jgi:hypothetical protein
MAYEKADKTSSGPWKRIFTVMTGAMISIGGANAVNAQTAIQEQLSPPGVVELVLNKNLKSELARGFYGVKREEYAREWKKEFKKENIFWVLSSKGLAIDREGNVIGTFRSPWSHLRRPFLNPETYELIGYEDFSGIYNLKNELIGKTKIMTYNVLIDSTVDKSPYRIIRNKDDKVIGKREEHKDKIVDMNGNTIAIFYNTTDIKNKYYDKFFYMVIGVGYGHYTGYAFLNTANFKPEITDELLQRDFIRNLEKSLLKHNEEYNILSGIQEMCAKENGKQKALKLISAFSNNFLFVLMTRTISNPYCTEANYIVADEIKRRGGKVKASFRNFVMDQIGPEKQSLQIAYILLLKSGWNIDGLLRKDIDFLRKTKNQSAVENIMAAFSYIIALPELSEANREKLIDVMLDIIEKPDNFNFWDSDMSMNIKNKIIQSAINVFYGEIKLNSKVSNRLIDIINKNDYMGNILGLALARNIDRLEEGSVLYNLAKKIALKFLPESPSSDEIMEDGLINVVSLTGHDSQYDEFLIYNNKFKAYGLKPNENAPKTNHDGMKQVSYKDVVKGKVTMWLKNIETKDALQLKKVFYEMLEDENVDYVLVGAHSTDLISIINRIVQDKREGSLIIKGKKIIQFEGCNSAINCSDNIAKFSDNQYHFIGTLQLTSIADGPDIMLSTVNGIRNSETWEEIEEGWSELELDVPDNHISSGNMGIIKYINFELGNTSAEEDLITYNDMRARPDIREPARSLFSVINYWSSRFEANARFLNPFRNIKILPYNGDGFRYNGWARDNRNTGKFILNVAIRKADEDDEYEVMVETNVAYSLCNEKAVKMMGMFELYNYLAEQYIVVKEGDVSVAKEKEMSVRGILTPENKTQAFLKAFEVLARELPDISRFTGREENLQELKVLFEEFKQHYNLPQDITFDMAYKAYWSKEMAGRVRTDETDNALKQVRKIMSVSGDTVIGMNSIPNHNSIIMAQYANSDITPEAARLINKMLDFQDRFKAATKLKSKRSYKEQIVELRRRIMMEFENAALYADDIRRIDKIVEEENKLRSAWKAVNSGMLPPGMIRRLSPNDLILMPIDMSPNNRWLTINTPARGIREGL